MYHVPPGPGPLPGLHVPSLAPQRLEKRHPRFAFMPDSAQPTTCCVAPSSHSIGSVPAPHSVESSSFISHFHFFGFSHLTLQLARGHAHMGTHAPPPTVLDSAFPVRGNVFPKHSLTAPLPSLAWSDSHLSGVPLPPTKCLCLSHPPFSDREGSRRRR